MADEQNQVPAPPPGFTPVAASPPPPPGFKPVDQPTVTNSAGETMPADVAARHAKTRVGKNYGPQPQNPGEQAQEAIGDILYGAGKEGAKTIQGAANLANQGIGLISGTGSGPIPVPFKGEDLETHGAAETVGGVGENILELATGDEILKGTLKGIDVLSKLPQTVRTIAEAHPKLLKALINVGKTSAETGAQGAVKESAEGGEGAAVGAKHGAEGGAMGAAIGELAAPVTKLAGKVVGLGTTSEEDIMKAAQPAKRNSRFLKDWSIAKDRIAQDLEANGKFENMHDAADRIGDVRRDLWKKEVAPKIAANAQEELFPNAALPKPPGSLPATTKVGDAIRDQLSPTLRKSGRFTEYADKLDKAAKSFDKPMKIDEAEQVLEKYNAELQHEGFWKKSPSERAAAIKADADTAIKAAAVDSLRNSIYDKLQQLGEPNMAELKMQYGAIKNIENEIRGQANVTGRLRNISLKKIIALASGHPLAIAGTVADALWNEPAAVLNRAVSKAAPDSALKATAKAAASGAGTVAKEAAPVVGSQWVRAIGGDGKHYEIHPEDVDAAKKQDPSLQIVTEPNLKP